MKSTKSKVKKRDGIVFTAGKVFSEDSYKHMRAYQDSYEKSKYRRFNMRMRFDEDNDIIEFLEGQTNLYEYLRKIIRADMKKKGIKTNDEATVLLNPDGKTRRITAATAEKKKTTKKK
ncbi:MAG: hypothetical protein IKF80_05765 [Erysipelotrichaceae bacterium]|nr:hypothetical protein [Erysipelotrichaceae bacterium]